jgi:PD-(D/E)XK nuclease superfamily protein
MPVIEQSIWAAVTPDMEILCPDGAWRTGQSLPPGLPHLALAPVVVRVPSFSDALANLFATFPSTEIVTRPSDQQWSTELRQRAAATVESVIAAPTLAAALTALATAWREDADRWATAGKRGGKSTATELRQAASRVAAVALAVAERAVDSAAPPVGQFTQTIAAVNAAAGQIATLGQSIAGLAPAPVLTGNGRCGHRALSDPGVPCVREPHETGVHTGLNGATWPYDAPAAVTPTTTPTEAYLMGATDLPPIIGEHAIIATQIGPNSGAVTTPVLSDPSEPNDNVVTTAPELQGGPFWSFSPADPTAFPDVYLDASLILANPTNDPATDAATLTGVFAPLLADPSNGRADVVPLADLLTAVPNRPELRDKRSVSQLDQYTRCGLAYRLNHYHKDQAPRRPQWSLVGGTAFHRAVEAYERAVLARTDPTDPNVLSFADGLTPEQLWLEWFNRTIVETATELAQADSPYVSMETWRAADRGKEGYDWWRVVGAEMMTNWLDWRATRRAAGWSVMRQYLGPDGSVPMIEWPFDLILTSPPPGALGPVWPIPLTVTGQIDLVEIHSDHGLAVIDLKTGKSTPDDAIQLAVYAAAVRQLVVLGDTPSALSAGWFMARPSDHRASPWVPARALPSLDVVTYRFAQMDGAERAGLYQANPSSFCAGCAVHDSCPIINGVAS